MKNVLVVYKKSVYELYSSSPDRELREFMAENNTDVERMKRSHDTQQRGLEAILSELDKASISYEARYRAELEGKGVGARDLVVSVGGDGTFLEVSHYLPSPTIPLLGINSDPNASTGFFTYAAAQDFGKVLEEMAQGKVPVTNLNRIEIMLDGKKIPVPVLNDVLVAHSNPAAMTRYTLIADGEAGEIRSSGLLVCTAAGSTAWMYKEGGTVMPLGSTQLQYFSRGVRGVKPAFADRLEVESHTRQASVFIDGAHLKQDFKIGSRIKFGQGPQLLVLGDLEQKRRTYEK